MTQPVMLIAGGTGSIGRSIADRALQSGWAVIIQGRSDSTVSQASRALQQAHGNAVLQGVVTDFQVDGTPEQLIAAAAELHGRLDAVIDCVATGPRRGRVIGAFEHTEPDAYASLLELSIVYFERLALAALPWLKATRGCLVGFISDAGIYPAPRQALIGAARSATIGFIRNLAVEMAVDGVRVHGVSTSFVLETTSASRLQQSNPGRIQKARQKAGLGLPTPADIAPLVLFLCSADARKMTGQIISVNGGLNV